eukprot:TRINITY_DN4996_c0_g1_i1.p1 TRINITY_DN4996_c0_g1~~TRINITY_DN4996_c0_g1_i1.p1  ORF type:complete len:605 (+),score=204.80 TRINITY_DN4996_c0_g1_i1:38-1852(+)
MESDGQIATELPRIMNDTVKSAGAEVLTAGPWDWVYTMVYVLISILLFSVIIYITFRCIKHFRVKNQVALLLKENKASKEASAARIEGRIGTRKDTEITSLPWHELTSRLKSGSLTASSALKAYQGAALEVDKKTNSVVCWVEDAEDQAKMLDSIPAGERGPLHGVPVSVKECYDIAGTYSSAGMVMFARNKAEVDSPVVELVKKLGGVPFCKTNVPQVMYSLQCSNPIYGTSTNPHGVGRECGGSSGGEGALIGGGGSILGLGSDIGGSLRNPAAFCGCYSLKPSAGRHLSQLGVVAGTGPSPVGISVVGGFMGQSAAAVEAGWKSVWRLDSEQNCQMVDTGVLPMSWDQKLYDKKPRIGYFTTDGMIDPAPGCVRAVTEALDRLKKAGFETVEIPSPDIYEVMVHFNGIVLAELNSGLYKNMSYDIYDSTLSGVVAAVTVYKLPWIIKKLIINPIMSLLTRIPPVVTVYNNATKLAAGLSVRDQFTRDYLKQMDNLGVDIILCPGQLLPAPPTGVLGMFVAAVSPYIPWNVMNFPAGIAPITKWTTDDDAKMADYPTDDMAYKMIRNYCKEAEGLPLSVQVVGRPYMDEQVLRILSVLEKFA